MIKTIIKELYLYGSFNNNGVEYYLEDEGCIASNSDGKVYSDVLEFLIEELSMNLDDVITREVFEYTVSLLNDYSPKLEFLTVAYIFDMFFNTAWYYAITIK